MFEKDKEYQKFHLDSFRRLPVDMQIICVGAVRGLFLTELKTQTEIVGFIQANPYTWWASFHHGWGTGMRNFLRGYYTDNQLPSTLYPDDRGEYKNWDDYYIGIVEVALEEGIYHFLDDSEKF